MVQQAERRSSEARSEASAVGGSAAKAETSARTMRASSKARPNGNGNINSSKLERQATSKKKTLSNNKKDNKSTSSTTTLQGQSSSTLKASKKSKVKKNEAARSKSAERAGDKPQSSKSPAHAAAAKKKKNTFTLLKKRSTKYSSQAKEEPIFVSAETQKELALVNPNDNDNKKESLEETSSSYLSSSTLGQDEPLRAYTFTHMNDSITRYQPQGISSNEEEEQEFLRMLDQQERTLDESGGTAKTEDDSTSIYEVQSTDNALRVSLVDESKGSSLRTSLVDGEDEIQIQYQSASGVLRKTIHLKGEKRPKTDSKPPLKSALSSGKTKKSSQSIGFSSVTVHYHGVQIGDCPFVQVGPPIARSWKADGEPDHFESLDDYEAQQCPQERGPVRFLSASDRYRLLHEAGYTHSEILRVIQQIHKLKGEMTDPNGPRSHSYKAPVFLRCLVPRKKRGVQKKNSMLVNRDESLD